MRLSSLLFAISILFLATTVQAQHPSRVRGKVTDKGLDLPNSEVILYQGIEKVRTLKTNECGEFNFGEVEPGDYDVEASIGTIKVIQSITLSPNTMYILNMYDGPPCPCCPSKQYVANPSWHGEQPRGDLELTPRI